MWCVAVTYVACAHRVDDAIRKVETEYLEHILCGRDVLPEDYVGWLEGFREWCVDGTCPSLNDVS